MIIVKIIIITIIIAVVESGSRHPCSSNALLYLPRNRGGRGLRSVKMEYEAMKIKGAVRLHGNQDPTLRMLQGFQQQVARMARTFSYHRARGREFE